jgi:tetratricopeptide (TPR) repeat protein
VAAFVPTEVRVIPLRLVAVAFGAVLAITASVLLPRLQQEPDRFSVAMDLIADGRGSDAVHLLDDRVWRGIAEYRANRYRRAATEFVQGDDITSLYNLGTTFARLGEWSSARAAYERVLALDPGHEDAAFNLSLVVQAAARQIADQEAGRQTRTLGAEKGAPGDDVSSANADGNETTTEDARPSDQAVPTEKEATKAGQIASAGRTGETARSEDSAAGRSADTHSDENDASGQTGAGGTRIIESAGNAEILLRAIEDNPEKVLSARLRMMDRLRHGGGQ